jgi:hypothetical protein
MAQLVAQVDVGDHQVEPLRLERGEGALEVAPGGDFEAVALEEAGYAITDVWLVVYDQDTALWRRSVSGR